MTRIILHGCGGRMGHVVADIVSKRDDCKIVAGIDSRPLSLSFPTFQGVDACTMEADVIIDFSTAEAVTSILDFAQVRDIPIVVCTTGLSDEQTKDLKARAQKVAVLKSANMSVGINLLIKLLKQITPSLTEAGFDVEIIEKHHNQKIDAPSGTAIALADAVNESVNNQMEYVYDRSQAREKRSKKEIGLHAVRGGTIVGEHDIIFAGRDEVIQFSHSAMSKEIFAVGAVKAALFLADKPAGLYTMKDVIV